MKICCETCVYLVSVPETPPHWCTWYEDDIEFPEEFVCGGWEQREED